MKNMMSVIAFLKECVEIIENMQKVQEILVVVVSLF